MIFFSVYPCHKSTGRFREFCTFPRKGSSVSVCVWMQTHTASSDRGSLIWPSGDRREKNGATNGSSRSWSSKSPSPPKLANSKWSNWPFGGRRSCVPLLVVFYWSILLFFFALTWFADPSFTWRGISRLVMMTMRVSLGKGGLVSLVRMSRRLSLGMSQLSIICIFKTNHPDFYRHLLVK